MNNKGVSLISLIITIIVMIILAGITVFNSLDTVDDAYLVKKEKEYNDVCTFVRDVSTKAEADMIKLSLTKDTLATEGQIGNVFIYGVETDLSSGDVHKMNDMNEAIRNDEVDAKYGYHYVTGKQIEYGIPGVDVSSKLENVENDYIINFYYGVVVAKISDTQTNVTGAVK